MYFESTRGYEKGISSANAIKQGIAEDGGLFVPSSEVNISIDDIGNMLEMSYNSRAKFILSKFLTDFSSVDLEECVDGAYSFPKFDNEKIAPLVKLNSTMSVLELWHGPTSAFKDMALQILPRLLVKSVKMTGEENEMVILVATSGDTGKAALEGFKDVPGTRIIVFYPVDGVSEVQRKQMITQEGLNVEVCAITGNFDDAQNGVKDIFGDKELSEKMLASGFKLSSANSINWGRLVPQIVYYFSGYLDMISNGTIILGEEINVVVPTGNFGNILAAYYAKKMGLPIKKMICASNENNVLSDFINTGKYSRNREFHTTSSPSMDILISSNLERLLYLLSDRDSEVVSNLMEELAKNGEYNVPENVFARISEEFFGGWATEQETFEQIKRLYNENKYLVDTHTAVGFEVYNKYLLTTGDVSTKAMIVSTASPFKFNSSVCMSIFGKEKIAGMNEFEMLGYLSRQTGVRIPEGLLNLAEKTETYNGVCEKVQMKAVLINNLETRKKWNLT